MKRWFVLLTIGSLLMGVTSATFSSAAELGIVPYRWVTASLIAGAGWIVVGFIEEARKVWSLFDALRSSLWIFLFFGLGWVLTSSAFRQEVLPDPTLVYFHLRRSYIETHWQVDPKSRLSYFPLDYLAMEKLNRGGASGKEIVPRNFLARDYAGKFSIDRTDGRLTSPSCPNAKYSARRLEGPVYAVRLYIDDVDEVSEPCLVAPTIGE
jgi:hypothetical protein